VFLNSNEHVFVCTWVKISLALSGYNQEFHCSAVGKFVIHINSDNQEKPKFHWLLSQTLSNRKEASLSQQSYRRKQVMSVITSSRVKTLGSREQATKPK